MAFKPRNMFYQKKRQEATDIGGEKNDGLWDSKMEDPPSIILQASESVLSNPFFKKLFNLRPLQYEAKRDTEDGEGERANEAAIFTLSANPIMPRLPFTLKNFSDLCAHRDKSWCYELHGTTTRMPTTEEPVRIPKTCGPTRPHYPHQGKWCATPGPAIPPECRPRCTTLEYDPCHTYTPTTRKPLGPRTTELCRNPTTGTTAGTTTEPPLCVRVIRSPKPYFILLKRALNRSRTHFKRRRHVLSQSDLFNILH
ncbi:hypothetical protein AAG570_008615 [Ranatra chinensis]|uniref:Uncharacterized protein n=1 Tax=Ranatra chinensis TaxID=642074 RepID=A0ABD0Z251_9HEMI